MSTPRLSGGGGGALFGVHFTVQLMEETGVLWKIDWNFMTVWDSRFMNRLTDQA